MGNVRRRTLRRAAVASLLTVLLLPRAVHAAGPPTVAAWATPMQNGASFPLDANWRLAFPNGQVTERTVREIVRATAAGQGVRVRLSNHYGDKPVTFGAVRVALRSAGAALQAGTTHRVLFGGRPSVTLAPGATVSSDVVAMATPALADLAVSLYVRGSARPLTWHRFANTTSFSSPANSGDRTADESGDRFAAVTESWFWLSGVDVVAAAPTKLVVALGDSITDGFPVAPDQHETWPDVLADRLALGGSGRWAVVNAGLAGNQLIGSCPECGPPAIQRIERDATALPGARVLVVFEGTNDLTANRTAAQIIDTLRRLVAAARARGLRVVGATITPRSDVGWRPAASNPVRHAVNRWIRTGGAFDAVLDFDAAVRDALNPDALSPLYDSGDHLHPNVLGLHAMADSIDLHRLVGAG